MISSIKIKIEDNILSRWFMTVCIIVCLPVDCIGSLGSGILCFKCYEFVCLLLRPQSSNCYLSLDLMVDSNIGRSVNHVVFANAVTKRSSVRTRSQLQFTSNKVSGLLKWKLIIWIITTTVLILNVLDNVTSTKAHGIMNKVLDKIQF